MHAIRCQLQSHTTACNEIGIVLGVLGMWKQERLKHIFENVNYECFTFDLGLVQNYLIEVAILQLNTKCIQLSNETHCIHGMWTPYAKLILKTKIKIFNFHVFFEQ